MNKEEKKQLWTYIAGSYGLLWGIFIILLILIQTGLFKVNFEGDSGFLTLIKIVASWTPTIAVFLFRLRLFPGKSIKEVFSGIFCEKLKIKYLFLIIALEVFTYLIASIVTSVYDHVSLLSQWTFSKELFISAFFISFFTGATGEESGWRGFLYPHFSKHYGCIKSGIMVGMIWGLWHTPFWLLSGYSGIGFFLYITQFLICTISWSVVMCVLYSWNHNLILPIAYHFFINFLLCFFCGNDLVFQITISILSIITAVGFAVTNLFYINKN